MRKQSNSSQDLQSKSRSRSRSHSKDKEQRKSKEKDQKNSSKEESKKDDNQNDESGQDQKKKGRKTSKFQSKFDLKPGEQEALDQQQQKSSQQVISELIKTTNNTADPAQISAMIQNQYQIIQNQLNQTQPASQINDNALTSATFAQSSGEVDSKSGITGVGSSTKIKPELQNNFRHARRIYIGNVSESITQEFLSEWLYRSMEICGGLLDQGNPILKTQIDTKNKYAFVEMRSIEEATGLLQLDGLFLWNRSLRIRRPTEYDKCPKVEGTRPIPKLDLSKLEENGVLLIPTQVDEGPNKLFLANIPTGMDEFTIIESLKLRDVGKLKSFHLVKDNKTNESKGYAFFDFLDPAVTDKCIESMNGLNLYNRQLTCKRAVPGQSQKYMEMGGNTNQIQTTKNKFNNNMHQPQMQNYYMQQSMQQRTMQQANAFYQQQMFQQQQQQFGQGFGQQGQQNQFRNMQGGGNMQNKWKNQ